MKENRIGVEAGLQVGKPEAKREILDMDRSERLDVGVYGLSELFGGAVETAIEETVVLDLETPDLQIQVIDGFFDFCRGRRHRCFESRLESQ
jgi:hypothetical protein